MSLRSEKGMTVLEIVVSMSILGLLAVGMMGFFTDSYKFQARNEGIVASQKLADEFFEELRNNNGAYQTINLASIADMEDDE